MNEMYGPESERPVDININMAKVMGVFLAQLRLVLSQILFCPDDCFHSFHFTFFIILFLGSC